MTLSVSTFSSSSSPSAERELVLSHYALVQSIARRMLRRLPQWTSLDEVVSDGTMGLLDAIRGFEPERGLSFESYAAIRIRGAILDGLRKADFVPRGVRRKAARLDAARDELRERLGRPPSSAEMARHLGVALGEYHDLVLEAVTLRQVSLDTPPNVEDGAPPLVERLPGESEDAEERASWAELAAVVPEAVEALPEPEQTVVRLYYVEGLLLREIGEILGVTESRVCQLRGKAIARLRRSLGRYLH